MVGDFSVKFLFMAPHPAQLPTLHPQSKAELLRAQKDVP